MGAHVNGNGPPLPPPPPMGDYTAAQIAAAVDQLSSREDQAVKKATMRISSRKKKKSKAKVAAEEAPISDADAVAIVGADNAADVDKARSLDDAMITLLHQVTSSKIEDLVEDALAPPPIDTPQDGEDGEDEDEAASEHQQNLES